MVEGTYPLRARVLSSVTKVPLEVLETWAARNTGAEDILVIGASANTFSVVERLEAIGHRAVILESHRAGKVGKAIARRLNDRL